MIVIYIDYRGPRSIETKRFAGFDEHFLDTLVGIEKNTSIIDSVKVFRRIQCSKDTCSATEQAAQETLINTTNAQIAVRRARKLAFA